MVLFQTGNTLFGQIYFNESKLLVQADIWFLDYFEYAEFDVILHVFCFRLEITALGKFCPSNCNYQFKLKFGTETNSNIQISIMVFSFSIFYRKYTFGSNLIHKNQNCQFKLKFGTQTNSKCVEFIGGVSLFNFRLAIYYLGKFGPKYQVCQCKLKFGIQNTLNMPNSMVLFSFSVLDQKYSF